MAVVERYKAGEFAERWSLRQQEAACVVALRGGDEVPHDIHWSPRPDRDNSYAALVGLIVEVCAVLTGRPPDRFSVETHPLLSWRLQGADAALGPRGRLEATALRRGLKRVLPKVCEATRVLVSGAAQQSTWG